MTTLKGLILAGGKSSRMGEDKGLINLHGLPLRISLYQMVRQAGLTDVYISCREDQLPDLAEVRTITDIFPDTGPLGAILSAFEKDPDAAWLVLACDMPLIREETIRQLVSARDISRHATAFSDENGNPQPLAAIWEPAILPIARSVFFTQNRSPRKVLLQSPIQLIIPQNPQSLTNVNDPESLARVRRKWED